MKKVLIGVILVNILFQSLLLACSSEEIRAIRSAHRVVAGKILSVRRLSSDGNKVKFSIKAKVNEVLLGAPMKDDLICIEMDLWKPKKDPSYEPDKSYVLYLRRMETDKPVQDNVGRWTVGCGAISIQPDTEKLRKKLPPNKDGKDLNHKASPESVDIKELSPLERRMHSIIIPEIDFRCANIYDVIEVLHDYSIEYALSAIPQQRKGINMCFNARTFTNNERNLVNFYIEDASLLQVLEITTHLTGGERDIINNNWVVISKKGSGKLKPALFLGSQGTNSVSYKTLQATIVPEIDFRQAAIGDVAKFLAKKSGLKISVTTNPEKPEKPTMITLHAKHVSQLSILQMLSILYPFEVILEEKLVIIRHATLLPSKGSGK
ncbi:hypothetical protein ACFLS1_04600 [Verrucomicrobiota bacterium]